MVTLIDRCSGCTSPLLPIPPDGPLNARVYIYGERPGQSEQLAMKRFLEQGIALQHYCFIGQAGREFNENYLHLAGLKRDDVHVGNTVLCGDPRNVKPKPWEARRCAEHHIAAELAAGNPEIVILMGGTACSLVPEIDLEADHGIPFKGKLFDWEGWIVAVYHPASGLHDSSYMLPLLEDFERLERWLSEGKWMWPQDWLDRDYALLETVNDFDAYIRHAETDLIGGDTESHDGVDWSIQFSHRVGTGRMILAENKRVLKEFGEWLNAQIGFADSKLVLHNASADLDQFERVTGFELDGYYRDTQQEAYHLIQHRQGLKPLSRRLLGRKRKSWEETVTPPSKEVLADWMSKAYRHAAEQWPEAIMRVSEKTGKPLKTKWKPHPAETGLFSIYQHMLDNPNYPADMTLWEKIRERLGQETIERLESVIGPMPQRGIAHVPLQQAIEYGCSDADDCLALAIEFDRMRGEFVEKLNIQDCDVDSCSTGA